MSILLIILGFIILAIIAGVVASMMGREKGTKNGEL